MVAHPTLASLKGAPVGHGIDSIVADIYDLAAAYCDPFADVQKPIFRQNGQDAVQRSIQRSFLPVHAVNDRFAVVTVKIQDVFWAKVIFLKPLMQIIHRRLLCQLDMFSIAYLRAEHKNSLIKIHFNGVLPIYIVRFVNIHVFNVESAEAVDFRAFPVYSVT